MTSESFLGGGREAAGGLKVPSHHSVAYRFRDSVCILETFPFKMFEIAQSFGNPENAGKNLSILGEWAFQGLITGGVLRSGDSTSQA